MIEFAFRLARGFRARLVLAVLAVFGVLVAFHIHGSSIGFTSRIWAPEDAMDRALAAPLMARMAPATVQSWRNWFRADPRWIRIDEWGHVTPNALAQCSHKPRFPVINTNLGNGANMLLMPWMPVAHVSVIARPVTWGYMLFGVQAGLAWSWWWPSFSCFVALYLLFEILVPRRPLLAVLGAGWFCFSAYVAGWSEWPGYVTSFIAIGVVCSYHLTKSEKRGVLLTAGAVLGLAVCGFIMVVYPPWQIPLAIAGACIFAGLVLRDRLWRGLSVRRRWRLQGVGLAVLIVAIVMGSFLYSTLDAIAAINGSVYPGQRKFHGGDFPDWKLFGGLYNYFTKNRSPVGTNESEASGFFLFFPAVMLAALVSPRIRSRLDPVAWLLMGYALFLVAFSLLQLPDWILAVTQLSTAQAFRAQIALGLVSIVLCIQLAGTVRRGAWREPQMLLTALVILVGCSAFYLWEGTRFQAFYHYFNSVYPIPRKVLLVSLGAAGLCAMMVLGLERIFSVLLGTAVLLTSWNLNPLLRGLPKPRQSELGHAVATVLSTDTYPDGRKRNSLWLTFGDDRLAIGSAMQAVGARTLAGIYQYPQLDLWRVLDPDRSQEFKYNRFAAVSLKSVPAETPTITFIQPYYTTFQVYLSPLHPAVRKLGARYVLTLGTQPEIKSPQYTLVYHSPKRGFAIWEIPPPALPGL